tara:strand:- start:7592 stop:7771 length:180 start_codon:yes stop_codon:yes gene_type:complete
MAEPNWVFILAMTTFAIAVVFILISMFRTRQDRKDHVKTSIPRGDIAEAREKRSDAPGL